MSRRSSSRLIAVLSLLAAAGAAAAQPTPSLTIVGCGTPTDLNASGNIVIGQDLAGAYRWTATGAPRLVHIAGGGLGVTACSGDAAFLAGEVTNTSGAGGLPTEGTISGRWSQSANAWQNLGVFAGLGGGQCGDPSSSINSPLDISSNGRFVVGGGWIGDACTQFRGYVWDANTGAMMALPGASGLTNRATRANGISTDGSVVVGFDEHVEYGSRVPAVWRRGAGGAYAVTLLDAEFGEAHLVNNAGTIIAGTSSNYGHVTKWVSDGVGGWTTIDLGTLTPPSWTGFYVLDNLTPTGMSEDGSIVVGIAMYQDFGSRIAGGFIWTAEDGVVEDLYTYLSSRNVPGIEQLGGSFFDPTPALGYPVAMSSDGTHIIGFGGPFTSVGPGWVLNLSGSATCLSPEICSQPQAQSVSRCTPYAVFNCGFSGSADGFSFQWRHDGQAIFDGPGPNGSFISGANTGRLFIGSATGEDAGSYDCVIANACGTVTTNAAAMSVFTCAPDFNCDLVLNSQDFFDFITAFFADSFNADFNGDFVVNSQDFFDFITAFFTGC